MTSGAIVLSTEQRSAIELAVSEQNMLLFFIRKQLRRDVHYGRIPGTDKDTLFLPGAEEVASLFRFGVRFEPLKEEINTDNPGEPFFLFMYRCDLTTPDGKHVMSCTASCNSYEEKYRYVNKNRKCPECGAEAILKGKQEYGGGFYCNKKKGGCGAKYKDDDERITRQEVGKAPNPRIWDCLNTVQRMAQKRSFVGAVNYATSAGKFFAEANSVDFSDSIDVVPQNVEADEGTDSIDAEWVTINVGDLPDIAKGNDSKGSGKKGSGSKQSGSGNPDETRIKQRIGWAIKTLGMEVDQIRGVANPLFNGRSDSASITMAECTQLVHELIAIYGEQRYVGVSLSDARMIVQSLAQQQPNIADANLLQLAQKDFEGVTESLGMAGKKPAPQAKGMSIG